LIVELLTRHFQCFWKIHWVSQEPDVLIEHIICVISVTSVIIRFSLAWQVPEIFHFEPPEPYETKGCVLDIHFGGETHFDLRCPTLVEKSVTKRHRGKYCSFYCFWKKVFSWDFAKKLLAKLWNVGCWLSLQDLFHNKKMRLFWVLSQCYWGQRGGW
jgi:hypothetical protein